MNDQDRQTIRRRDDGRAPGLSFAQHRLWYLDQLDPNLPTYNMPFAFRLSGRLDRAALERSLTEIVRRHEVLRTSFVLECDAPVQVVAPAGPAELPVVDLRRHLASERERALDEEMARAAHRPFDLAAGPLWRALLVQLEETEHVFLFIAHHSVFDGWSLGVFLRELAALYEAFAAGKPALLPDPPIQYADYSVWQRKVLEGDRLDQQLAHWRGALAGRLPVLELPLDHPRPASQTFHGAWETMRLPRPLVEALVAVQRSEGVTSFMLLLAAFDVLLYRHTGQEDVIVGSPVAGRNRSELEGLLGFFVNNLSLRADLSGDPTFREFLRRVRAVCLGAYRHQELPFERLVEEIRPERDLSRTPVFQVMFDVHRAQPEIELPGLTIRHRPLLRKTSHFDLTLFMRESPEGLEALLNYNTDLFEPATARRLLDGYRTLLESIVAQPDLALSRLPILAPDERRRILEEWNATATPFVGDQCVHRSIEAQAERTPEATAVAFQDRSLTYGELNARSNQLARRLRALGVGPETRVGVFVDRSLDMLVALLGVLKAGGAYVPLDPAYPAQRIGFMLSDAGVPVVLTQQRLLGSLPRHEAKVVALDTDWASIAAHPAGDLDGGTTADSVAYVNYTSGSTGQPKGVIITHRNLQNFFTGMDQRIGGEEPGVWLAVTSINFDISVLELFWTLTRGFKIVIQSHDEWTRSASGRQTRFPDRRMAFSLFYFAANEGSSGFDKYRLLLEGAKIADELGFEAVWTPERHFEAFGGLYPNPAVAGAAIAAITRNVKIRAGSCVLPLHDPLRVAEEWALVDNLSNGRVGMAIASGWHDRDFVFFPERFQDRKNLMFRHIEILRRLWQGEKIKRTSGVGTEIEVGILPQPVQRELPLWITASGSPETFARAGAGGFNVLTHLLGQSIEELTDKIAAYREAWRKADHGPGAGQVTLMLHTYVDENMDHVREMVREPFTAYLRTAVGLFAKLAEERGRTLRDGKLSEEDLQALLGHAFDRYFDTSALFGTPATCLETIDRLKEIGVNEVACLIDFGLDTESALSSLPLLAEVMRDSNPGFGGAEYSIADQIDHHGVTHLQCTPSMAGMLAAGERERTTLGRLKKLMIGGEAFPPALAAQLRSITSAEIVNMYGPTETTVWSSTAPIDGGPITLGRPIANTEFYVLDRHGAPVPVGVPGELYIGGAGVAQGYLNRSELTEERFPPHPFRDEPGARIYRTGDLVRYRPDGEVEFLGRLDHQVKIRGHRIELGEIEALLAQNPAVRETVVLAREDVPGDKRLVGYIVLAPGGVSNAREIQAWLRERLPEIMVPSVVVVLEALPLTPNGKVDRKALPAPDLSRTVSVEAFVGPRNTVEQIVAGIWRELLGIERVGVHDNFFELGGHSLSAVQLGLRLRQAFMVDVPLRSLFESPTVEDVSVLMGRLQPKADRISEIILQVKNLSPEEASRLLEQRKAPR